MKLTFSDEAWEDDLYGHKHEREMVERINKLIKEMQRDPLVGVCKPEPLRHALGRLLVAPNHQRAPLGVPG